MQNAQNARLTERHPGNTGLIDAEKRSYRPVDYDARLSPTNTYVGSADVLPGSVADFALVFSVPRGTKPSLLIFTLPSGTDVRVSLSN